MPGLLDLFGGDNPQTQGLLAAAAGILNASGPSLMPRSLGQVAAAGVGGYQDGQRQALMNQAYGQNLKINNMRLQDMESDLKNQEAQRQRAQDLLKTSSEYWQGGGMTAPPFPGGQSAAQMMGGLVSGAGVMQPPQQEQAPQPGGRNASPYQQRLAYAQYLRSKGYGAEAQAEEDSALKLQPKVKEWQKVQQGGKVMYAPYFEDGTSGQPVPLEVAEKLDAVNRGGATDMVNPYTGATVRSMANSISPDTAATVGVQRDRLALDKSQAGKPTFSADAGGFIYAPSASAPQGGFVPAAGFVKSGDKQKVQDASDVLSILNQAEPLIKTATGSYGGVAVDQAARLFGSSTAGSQDAAKLKALEGNLVSKMPKMSGPQSDKDVAMYRQMAGQIGDPTVPVADKRAAIETIKEIAARNAGKKYISLSDIAETARRSGKTTAEVTAAAHDKGYVIGGQ
jgi:hypothetical protein